MRAVHVRLGKIDNVKKNYQLPEYSDFAYRRLPEVLIMTKPIISEVFACNGEFSHYELINPETGVKLWEGDENEQYYHGDKYLNKFADRMMSLANRLNEVVEYEYPDMRDDFDIQEDYRQDIQNFINKVTGL